ncbi:MAG TPA: TadE/TadG family type IV pilus assembly protein [Acidobacteriaceae bacterium]|nr:TadE/TadG family type IV pilus assembly protein [Acidobacteriaceae bacterium]
MKHKLLRRIRQGRKEQHGSSLVEFAITALVLLTLLFGIVDFSRAMYAWAFVSWAAQSGTRYAIVHGAKWSGTTCSTTSTQDCDATNASIQSYVQGLAPPGVTGGNVQVNTQWPATTPDGGSCSTANGQGCFVEVTVSYTFNFITPFLPTSGIKLSSTSEQVVQE